jgi:hypothetical protein
MPMSMKRSRSAAAATLSALALMVCAGCSGSGSQAATATPSVTPLTHDLSSYDAFVVGSAEDNPLFSDLYGIRFSPYTVDRITTDKRISSLGADEQHLMVAAGDEQIDKLAQVTGSGDLVPIPGLGRPHAYSPSLRDGVMYYSDAEGDDATGENRYFAWDLTRRAKKLLFSSKDDVAPVPASGGRLVLTKADKTGKDELLVRDASGQLTHLPVKARLGVDSVGRDFVAAATLVGGDSNSDPKADGLILVTLKTGKAKRVPGLLVVCWSPDGTRLLAMRTGTTTSTQLVLVDLAAPDAPPLALQTLPFATYEGVWVRGGPARD